MSLKKFDYILFILNLILFIVNIGKAAYLFGMGDKHFITFIVVAIFNLVIGLLCRWASKLI